MAWGEHVIVWRGEAAELREKLADVAFYLAKALREMDEDGWPKPVTMAVGYMLTKVTEEQVKIAALAPGEATEVTPFHCDGGLEEACEMLAPLAEHMARGDHDEGFVTPGEEMRGAGAILDAVLAIMRKVLADGQR